MCPRKNTYIPFFLGPKKKRKNTYKYHVCVTHCAQLCTCRACVPKRPPQDQRTFKTNVSCICAQEKTPIYQKRPAYTKRDPHKTNALSRQTCRAYVPKKKKKKHPQLCYKYHARRRWFWKRRADILFEMHDTIVLKVRRSCGGLFWYMQVSFHTLFSLLVYTGVSFRHICRTIWSRKSADLFWGSLLVFTGLFSYKIYYFGTYSCLFLA